MKKPGIKIFGLIPFTNFRLTNIFYNKTQDPDLNFC